MHTHKNTDTCMCDSTLHNSHLCTAQHNTCRICMYVQHNRHAMYLLHKTHTCTNTHIQGTYSYAYAQRISIKSTHTHTPVGSQRPSCFRQCFLLARWRHSLRYTKAKTYSKNLKTIYSFIQPSFLSVCKAGTRALSKHQGPLSFGCSECDEFKLLRAQNRTRVGLAGSGSFLKRAF